MALVGGRFAANLVVVMLLGLVGASVSPSFPASAPAPPKVTSITPTSGPAPGGTKVTIKGSGFVAGATVTIGNAATSVNVLSATRLTATTAATPAGTDEVVVTDANGTSTGGPSYTYVKPPLPTVTSISPTSGASVGGTIVTVKGTGFLPGATVTIGNPATAVNVVSSTKITATTAATPVGTAEVVVSDEGGTSTGGPTYAYINASRPKVASVTPSSGPIAGGTPVTIKGSGFLAGATVTIGNEASAVNVVSSTKITATTAPTAAGSYKVVVKDGAGTSTGGPTYTYLSPASTVASITPASGPSSGGTAVTIKGSGFLAGATVTIGNEATSVTVVSETEIKATTVATTAGADEVVVSDANGTSTSGPSYTYLPPPTVTSVSPASGPSSGGTTVMIAGTGFVAGAAVTIGSAATSVNVVSESEITATTSTALAGSDEVVVSDAGGTSTGGPSFTYLPPPTVTSITPTSGPSAGGTPVTIHGSGFLGGATVTIGNAATSVNVVSETEIRATTAPTSAGSDEVVVSDANGTSTGGPSYTYISLFAPTVTSITPTSGPAAGGTAVTIKGSGFLTGSTVTIGNAATSVNVVSETEIEATTAATPAGSYEVVVSDVGGTSSGGPSYTYVAPPIVTSITPTSGPSSGGTAVTLKGSGFVAGATVTIGNAATSVSVVSETEIKATTAATAAGSNEVVVTDSRGTSTGGSSYTYLAAPKVTSITPTSGPAAGGTAVTLKGSGFLAGSTVTIGNAATGVSVVSETEIKATTASTTAGSYEVVVSDGGGASTGGPSYTYVAPPIVTSITPTSGPVAGGTAVTIKGSGFVVGATVTIGSAATGVSVVSEAEIKATTASTTAGSYEVVVSDGGGTSTGGPSYAYLAPPTVTSITPTSGPSSGGTAVTLKGSGFVAGATVTIGNAATSVSVVSETEIKATTAATAAGSSEVVVTDSRGTSTGGPSYTYLAAPKVTSIGPTSGPAAGGTAVTLKGSGFLAGSTVTIGNAATGVSVVSETEIKATTASTTAGSYEVVVSDGGGTSTGGPSYAYLAPPTVTSITPTAGPSAGGTAVTIKGSGFVAGATVTIGNAATSVSVVSETEIKATTAATAAGSSEVVVTDLRGTSTGGPSYTYLAAPKVTSITPTSGPSSGGTAVTLKGSGFVAGATVTIGNAATSVSVVSETEVKATTTATAPGSNEVVVTDSRGTSTGGPSYTYLAAPKVTSISPTSGPAAGGTAVTLKGSGFVAGATVTIGNAATSVSVVSETEVKATTTATAPGSNEVVVTDSRGTSTGGPSYTYLAAPKVTSITPSSGPAAGGTAVTLKGSGFVAGATVTIGSAATGVSVVSEAEIKATTAATAPGSNEVVVTDSRGTSTGGPSYTYLAAPKVTSISPTSGPAAGGTAVTLKGSGFVAGATVTIGNAATSVSVVSGAEIKAATASTTEGAYEVVVTDGGGTSTGGPMYTYLAPVLAAAGDIACPAGEKEDPCQQQATANLVSSQKPTSLAVLGDSQYNSGLLSEYNSAGAYNATWGPFNAIAHPAPGNHEYAMSSTAAGYFSYFGSSAGNGNYSYELGSWHIISLNSNCSNSGCTDSLAGTTSSATVSWLQSDLAAHPNQCTLAYWHHPRFTSGFVGNSPGVGPFWEALYAAHADIVLNGHDHMYERFAQQDPSQHATTEGIREFVAGAGGESLFDVTSTQPNMQAVDNKHFGVLFLTLRNGSYEWAFRTVEGTVVDSGSASCHTPPKGAGAMALPQQGPLASRVRTRAVSLAERSAAAFLPRAFASRARLTFGVRPHSVSLRSAVKHGLPVDVHCTRACDVRVTAYLHLDGRLVKLASYRETESEIPKPFSRIVLRLPDRALDHLGRARLTLSFAALDASFERASAIRTFALGGG
jgi:hypothetical protein